MGIFLVGYNMGISWVLMEIFLEYPKGIQPLWLGKSLNSLGHYEDIIWIQTGIVVGYSEDKVWGYDWDMEFLRMNNSDFHGILKELPRFMNAKLVQKSCSNLAL